MNRIFIFLISLLFFSNTLFSATLEDKIKKEITHYFYCIYHAAPKNMEISYLRFPDVSGLKKNAYKIRVSSQKPEPRLGYQTLWVELSANGNRVKRFPVSLDIGVEAHVVISKKRINRHETFKPEYLAIEVQFIKADWDLLCHSLEELVGNESTRVIQKNTIMTRNLFRPVPLIRRGDIVEVQFETGNLFMTSDAIAKNDAAIGDKLQVESLSGGKRLKTTVKGPGLVCFTGEN